MNLDEDGGRTTWIPMAVAGVFVAIIVTLIFTIDGAENAGPEDPAPSTPSSTSTP